MASVSDSFQGALVEVIHQPPSSSMVPEFPTFTPRESVDTEAVAAFLQVLGWSVRFMTSSFARMYMNSALTRRDAVLSSSVAPRASKASLRALPLASGSLFGPHLEATTRSQADRQRDMLALNAGSYSHSRKRV